MQGGEIMEENSTKKSFWKDKKNIAIVVLAVVLFFTICGYGGKEDVATYETEINSLNSKITELNNQIKEYGNIINTQKETINTLKEGKSTNKTNSESVKAEASSKQTNSSTNKSTTTSASAKTTSSSSKSSNSSNKSSSSSKNSQSSSVSNIKKESAQKTDNKTEMVWVGNTGTKYHYEDCRTLKGKGHQITLQQALAEGREPCKVCH